MCATVLCAAPRAVCAMCARPRQPAASISSWHLAQRDALWFVRVSWLTHKGPYREQSRADTALTCPLTTHSFPYMYRFTPLQLVPTRSPEGARIVEYARRDRMCIVAMSC